MFYDQISLRDAIVSLPLLETHWRAEEKKRKQNKTLWQGRPFGPVYLELTKPDYHETYFFTEHF